MTTEHATSTDGVRIAYERVADAAPRDAGWTVLVHGLGYARWGWGPFADRLAERSRLVLLDNRGIGDSDVPDGPYTASAMAEDVVAVLDGAGIDRAHVVGSSLGGMIAQELAISHPDRVERLVLLSTTPGGEDAHPMPEVTRRLIAEMPGMAPEEALRRAVANALSPATVAARPELVDEIVALRLAAPQDPAGWRAQAHAGVTYDGGGRLGRIVAPTLVLHGTDDVVVDPANARVLVERIPAARELLVDGLGHLPFWEDPVRLAGVVGDFLSEGGERSGPAGA